MATLRRMLARDPLQAHRASTPLELFFDLVFVVAISLASSQLHHFESENHVGAGVGSYLMVFFAIWWAWLNFTWFASAFDTDDWLYRLTTFIQLGGALVLAAGTVPAMTQHDFSIVILGYVIMRIALVSQWLRVSFSDPEYRQVGLRYGAGITVVQLGWIAFYWVPDAFQIPSFLLLVVCDVLVPVIAERRQVTKWHPEHISERYGLFTLIVLGETILASTNAVVEAIAETEHLGQLVLLSATGLVIVCAIWWVYFTVPQADALGATRFPLLWGYSHYFIYASAAALSAGLEVAIDIQTEHTDLASVQAAATTTIPVAVLVFSVWLVLIRRSATTTMNVVFPMLAATIALSAFLPYSLQVTAALTVLAACCTSVVARSCAPSPQPL
ncbi:low temperature requirement protein A [Lysinibacter cavernae]|uniref:Low temperature requirement protein LtrA n=1 Tax=Lysinibacter cavernae TaxID=1640652 RepID=A0A7X5TU06_9MICO|nr:low temperature requirement protein A [Lysinibacter cavernae]NIH55176.1 low temperature requirement protein LtrA [Lysinibacter cavernae]